MKSLFKYALVCALAMAAVSCEEGIDDITAVPAGVDATAPQITIMSPVEGSEIKVFEEVTTLEVEFEVTDDIEVKDVTVLLDGNQIAFFNSFKDYRIVKQEFIYDGLTDGSHTLTVRATDLDGKTSTADVDFVKAPPYIPLFAGEVFYMPFDGDYRDLIGFQQAEEVGSPGFAGDGFIGLDAYRGTQDSYLEFPMDGLKTPEFSATFWYKLDASPTRAGILVVGDDNADRFQGFRFFREGSATEQRFKLNVGTGNGETWNDGGVIDATAGEWVHIALTISQTETKIYLNGMETLTGNMAGPIDWTGCEVLTIGSGGPTFDYWDHKSDFSDIDELRLFNRALSQTDIQLMINAASPYFPKFGETLYMPFNGDFIDQVNSAVASPVGTPGFSMDNVEGGQAFMSATDSYINYPAERLIAPEFSGAFWYKVNASPDRAGMIVISDNDDRNQGFRLFREGSSTAQRIKLNVGTGGGESWNDGIDLNADPGEWVHIAFTIATGESKLYLNGQLINTAAMSAPIDWTGCEVFTIGSGGPTFSYWNHFSDLSVMDELYFFDRALTAEEVQDVYGGGYEPLDGEVLYVPFEGSNADIIGGIQPTVTGTPGFAGEGQTGNNAYAGAADSYLTFPTDGLLGEEFTASMMYKLNADPDRAGILVVGPPDTERAEFPEVQNLRTNGFRFFREATGNGQTFKLNVGNGTADNWFDGGASASIPVDTADWVHLAFTISGTECVVYVNGEIAAQGSFSGVDWSGCDIMTLASGVPRFTEWNHRSDLSYIDEFKVFNRALTQQEIQDLAQ